MRLLISTILTITYLSALGQQILYEHYFLNNYLINPAVAGLEQYVDLQVGHRSQWTGIEGSPSTTYISIHSPIGNSEGKTGFSNFERSRKELVNVKRPSYHGLGGFIMQDQVGPFLMQEVGTSYAVHLPLTIRSFLSFGAAPSLSIRSLDNGFFDTGLANDPLVAGYQNRTEFNLKLGIWYFTRNFYTGISAFSYQLESPEDLFFTTGYRYPIPGTYWSIIPFGISRYVNTEYNFDLGLKATWDSRLSAGFLFRTTRAATSFVGVNLSSLFSVTYLYNTIPGNSTDYIDANTHEINLQFRINNKDDIMCPVNPW